MSDSLYNQISIQARRNRVLFTLASVLLLIFITLSLEVSTNFLAAFDHRIISAVWAFRAPVDTKIMILITCLGNLSFLITLTLIGMFICLKNKRDPWFIVLMLVSLLGAAGLNSLLKNIFQRSRPGLDVLITATGYSFPSGHAMLAAAFYGMLTYWLWHILRSRPAKFLAVGFLGLLILAIGISRVYLGVHYPSDVIAGFAAGGTWLVICIAVSENMRAKK